jgi:hypothetical protein
MPTAPLQHLFSAVPGLIVESIDYDIIHAVEILVGIVLLFAAAVELRARGRK